ncbi:mediator of RNA polymerase II transcription subunit 8 [Ctenopharyngodon idella]|uniref:mediator of RNA polymerase II transcription subunit 8 n=1 Tax=Ctenopharyngodon idella TaxID=7959 RepID=UPI00222EA7F4|nr:mediator of RNA polymerase II transcription subunit 8 [Ctenopharyngodon idella]
MQQREEKQLEASIESLVTRVAHLKGSLQSFIYKLENEYERLTWPSVLDNFALLSGQLNTINKLLRNEKTPSYRSQVIIPLLLSPDRDEELAKLTEQRVPVFSHEIVPDHLRTKPDPEVEEQEKHLSAEAARIGPEVAQKQIQTLNKLCSNLLEKLNNPRDDRDSETSGSLNVAPRFYICQFFMCAKSLDVKCMFLFSLRQNKPSFNPADTNALVAAVGFGKGLSKCRPPGPVAPGHPGQPMMSTGPTLHQVTVAGTSSHQAGMGGQVAQQQPGQPGKMPSNIKTNIKSASASMHPYNR